MVFFLSAVIPPLAQWELEVWNIPIDKYLSKIHF